MTVQKIPFLLPRASSPKSAPGLSVRSGPSPPRRRLRSASAPLKRNTTMPATTAGATSWAIISCAIVTMGEPPGHGGQPMLNVFQREGVGNVCAWSPGISVVYCWGAGGLTRPMERLPGTPSLPPASPPWACGSRCSWSATMACWSASSWRSPPWMVSWMT